MGRLGDVALDCVHFLGLHPSDEPVDLYLQLLNHLVLLDDGLVERLHQLLQVRQVGLDIDQPFVIRHGDSVTRTGPGIDNEGPSVLP